MKKKKRKISMSVGKTEDHEKRITDHKERVEKEIEGIRKERLKLGLTSKWNP